MDATLPPVTLRGSRVVLEPLSLDHVDALAAAADADRSTFALAPVPEGRDAMQAHVADLLDQHSRALAQPFAQRRADTGEVVGCTRYLDLHWWLGRPYPDEVEIGGTWLARAAQRTGINREAKLLLLTHAFEVMNVQRVQICTDARNERSRTAIASIGATFEGGCFVTTADRPTITSPATPRCTRSPVRNGPVSAPD